MLLEWRCRGHSSVTSSRSHIKHRNPNEIAPGGIFVSRNNYYCMILAVMVLRLRELALVIYSSTLDGQLLQRFKGQFPQATLKMWIKFISKIPTPTPTTARYFLSLSTGRTPSNRIALNPEYAGILIPPTLLLFWAVELNSGSSQIVATDTGSATSPLLFFVIAPLR